MRAINHSLTGALIGLAVADPLAAAPLALASHFVLDSLPHFGLNNNDKRLSSRIFITYLIIDVILCASLVGLIVLNRPIHWVTAIICAFLAAAPDFLFLNHFYKAIMHKPWKAGWYTKFAGGIQWFEKPIGMVVEAVWLVSMVYCVSIFLRH